MAGKQHGLEDVLREVKDGVLCYAVILGYGQQEFGLDDTGMADEERDVFIEGVPAGLMGEVRVRWQGTVASLKALDLFQVGEQLLNPPQHGAFLSAPYRLRPGVFYWGTNRGCEGWPEKVALRRSDRKP